MASYRSQNDMAALGGIAGSENRLISFFQRTKTLLAEAEQHISLFLPTESTDRIEMACGGWGTVYILKERAAELLLLSERDLEIDNFHSNMHELSIFLKKDSKFTLRKCSRLKLQFT